VHGRAPDRCHSRKKVLRYVSLNLGGTLRVNAGGPAQVDLTPDTTLAVYSCAKLVVAIAVMQLVERGELELDQDVAGILCVLEVSYVLAF